MKNTASYIFYVQKNIFASRLDDSTLRFKEENFHNVINDKTLEW